ncbi:hypothetical protein AVEN_38278-1 [Araneus ventricosus]|uniref:BTB domain-containing protein n=1 Tax=Araneus ventricosus TaxID=182803 RepID=A0A4Y2E719_ARAVE|nr:hypothetical protein AVEN_38278-1 [Araneus ventricosus]
MFTVRNNSVRSDMFEQMKSLPTDCILVCRYGNVAAHRLVLSSTSSFFMANITQLPTSSNRIFLPQFDVQDIQVLVDFIYGRAVTVDYDRLLKLVGIAQDLGITAFDTVMY